MKLSDEQIEHLESEAAEDGATMINTSELRVLVEAYKRLRIIETLYPGHDWSDLDPSEQPRF